MPEIVAANNLTIQFDDNRWRLLNGRGEEGTALVTAGQDGLAFTPNFASVRRLPSDGYLSTDQVQMVAVGWASEDATWHLGLLLASELAQQRGSRWCGLARWPDAGGELAEQAGQALAELIQKPLRVVPPPGQPPPPPAEIPPMPPPITLDEWHMVEGAGASGLVIEHTSNWYQGLLMRAIFFSALTPLFFLLSLGALLSTYAPVNPPQLPLLGIAISAVLLLSAVNALLGLRRGPVTTLDPRARLLRQTGRTGKRVLVQSPYEGLQYVMVSHVINRRRTKTSTNSSGEIYSFGAEVWIHVYSPRRGFILVCHITDVEGRARADIEFTPSRPLHLYEIDSPAHHMALRIGQEIGIPVYAEER